MKVVLAFFLLCGVSLFAGTLSAQEDQNQKTAILVDGPPNLLLLVHQELQGSKLAERQKLQTSLSRGADRVEAANFWIEMESITGPREALFLDPFDSFQHLEQSAYDWAQTTSSHPDMLHIQDELDATVLTEHTSTAIRRDDLGYLAQSIDLSRARFVRIEEVRVFPGHEEDFEAATHLMVELRTALKFDSPFVVYQVNAGLPSPTFFIVFPMVSLSEDDNQLTWHSHLEESEGAPMLEKLKQIARDSYSSSEGNLYVIHPEMSHVPREFAAADANYWRPGGSPKSVPRSESTPRVTPSKKVPYQKP